MIIPPKLKAGDEVRIIAPSCSMASIPWLKGEFLERAKQWFEGIGCTVSEGKNIRELDSFSSSSIKHRIADLTDAFSDSAVKAIIATRGGWNANQLLDHIDYDLIRQNPKILSGFSDITVLSNAIYAQTGLVGYSGPNFSQFALGSQLQYTHDAFRQCLMQDEPFSVQPSSQWTNDRFKPDHQALDFEPNEGWWTLGHGEAEGTIIGGNLCTLNLLQGTKYMPPLKDSILFLEDDFESSAGTFDRNLQSLIHLPDFNGVRGIVIGRFEKNAANGMPPMTNELLRNLLDTHTELNDLPIIANVDFGHTQPMITFPIGGKARIKAGKTSSIEILKH